MTDGRSTTAAASQASRRIDRESRVSVVICAYTEERWSLLESAIESVRVQEPVPTEIVVVVDHNPRLHDRLAERFDHLQLHHNAFRKGLSGARNTGVAASQGDVVAFLDDDARAEPGWLDGHSRHYDDPAVVGVGGPVRPIWQDGPPSWFPEEFAWVVGCSHSGIGDHVHDVRNPVGANMSFRRSSVQAAGGFREELGRVGTLPLGCEETELAIRMTATTPGARIVHEPGAAVLHHVPSHRASWAYFTKRCWSEGLSKALVSQLAGARDGLSEERSYVTRTLPAGIGRSIREATAGQDHRHLARAGAIVAGLGLTTGGYVAGRVRTAPAAALV